MSLLINNVCFIVNKKEITQSMFIGKQEQQKSPDRTSSE